MKNIKIITIIILSVGLFTFPNFFVFASYPAPDTPSDPYPAPDTSSDPYPAPDTPSDPYPAPDTSSDPYPAPDTSSDPYPAPDTSSDLDPVDPGPDPVDPGPDPVDPGPDPVDPDPDPVDPVVPGPSIPPSTPISIVSSGGGGSYGYTPPILSIKKTVSSFKGGEPYTDSIIVEPSELISFLIEVSVKNGSIMGIIVKDDLPEGIIYAGGLEVNGISVSGDITEGISMDLPWLNQIKKIIFYAVVADAESFAFGQTKLTNTVSVKKDNVSRDTDTAEIIVSKKEVAGIATDISTGLTNNIFLDTFFLPLLIALFVVWVLRSHIIKHEEWMDVRIKQYKDYKSKKNLQLKIAGIKTKEFFNKKII
jgi:hypothetical protein